MAQFFASWSYRGFLASGLSACAALVGVALAQPSSTSPLAPPANGPRRVDPTYVVLTDVTLHIKAGETLQRGAVVFREGRIAGVLPGSAGPDGTFQTPDDEPARAPVGARVIDGAGLHVYPAFIDPYVEVDAPAPIARDAGNADAHWNTRVTPQRTALDGAGMSEDLAGSLREMGFAAACISPKGGVFAGSSALVSLAKPASDRSAERPAVYREGVYQSVAFDTSGGGYPDSQMGALALIRQTLSDAAWQRSQRLGGRMSETPNAVDALNERIVGSASKDGVPAPLLMNSNDEFEALRAGTIAREFNRPYAILGSGEEFARLEAIQKDANTPLWRGLILPLNFPKAPDVSSPAKAESVELRDMMMWEQAPTNPRRLSAAGLDVALTTSKLKRRGDFMGNLRKAIAHGWSEDQALAALTTTPARMLGIAGELGTIEVGKRASVIVADGEIFKKKTKLRSVWIDGVAHELFTPPTTLEGTWDVAGLTPALMGYAEGTLTLSIDKDNAVTLQRGDAKAKAARVSVEKQAAGFTFDPSELKDTPKKEEDTKDEKEAPTPDAKVDETKPEGKPEGKPDAPVIDAGPDNSGAPSGVWLMSASIERDARGTPVRLVGQGVRADGERFRWSAMKRPTSIAGEWPIFFQTNDPARQRGGVLRITEDTAQGVTTTSVTMVNMAPEGEGRAKESRTQPKDVSWDGTTLRYTLSREQMGGQYPDVTITALLDSTTTPPTLRGIVSNPNGQFPFTARKTDAKTWWKGTWRVIAFDGRPKPADAKDNVDIVMEEKSATVVFINQDWVKPATPAKPDDKGDIHVRVKLDDFKVETKDDVSTITFAQDLAPVGGTGTSSDTLVRIEGELHGTSTQPDGSTHTYVLRPTFQDAKDDEDPAPKDIPESLGVPFGPYALQGGMPAQANVALTNATVWTNTEQGTLKNATVLLNDGTIRAVYKAGAWNASSAPQGMQVLDLAGKHVTAGIIDAHSHTGISRGVNEGGQAVTAEVRIQDVTNPDDVNWYRQLAGGVTSVLSLHGSANAIGGQSQVNKLRWGCARPEDMHMQGAIAGIKFALGENPRSVNWDAQTTQYPRSRMGVEMLIRDRFTAAREYAAARADTNTRRDLELEALAEILAGTRLVHCHSYRQDEMVMLAHVAQEFGFTIGTYTHALEGYKVADYVRDHALGASGFADWWAFKVEVQDAIPYAFPIMHKVGVTASFNSDSNELARRLNLEAAKAVKYGEGVGGISPEEAWKFVTLNPAKQLKIESRVGALKEGMDADVVVWSADPLSTYARVERTYVDGRELFSLAADAQARARNASERTRLIQKLLTEGKKKPDADKSESPAGPARARRRPPSDDGEAHELEYAGAISELDALSADQRQQLREIYIQMLQSGRDPRFAPGVCGCGTLHVR
jgi:imidazolonepropionase-like amidohydrolase